MSASMAASEDAVSAARDSMVHDYLDLLSMTMLYYDQLLTLPAEIAHIWTTPRSVSSILFLSNKWLGLIGNLVVAAVTFMRFPPEECVRCLFIVVLVLDLNSRRRRVEQPLLD
ncbi:hypothetical protein PLICRDRAFT_450367 [Plicaturopsis crispa FD-325 SS-3]|uniref:DUF6533 domain-containing protein n=1 Tax=Plicaturopsis crispa FD-325 SS-3 TaxID=944288 RepID=A0A0C9SVY3_PLICR|nr:hypothetical protein PLICRDRAFT_450367 [Plicaturopsis crispa FD-325 SS-3]